MNRYNMHKYDFCYNSSVADTQWSDYFMKESANEMLGLSVGSHKQLHSY